MVLCPLNLAHLAYTSALNTQPIKFHFDINSFKAGSISFFALVGAAGLFLSDAPF